MLQNKYNLHLNILFVLFRFHLILHFVSFRFFIFRFVSLYFVLLLHFSFRFFNFRFVSLYFVSVCDTSFRFVSFLHFSFRFVVFRFVSFHFVSFRFVFVSQFSSTRISLIVHQFCQKTFFLQLTLFLRSRAMHKLLTYFSFLKPCNLDVLVIVKVMTY